MSLRSAPTYPSAAANPPLLASDNLAGYEVGAVRHARLFRNGANQAMRIPKEFELQGDEVLIRQEGSRLVIELVKPAYEKGSPAAMLAMLAELAQLGPCDDAFPDVDASLPALDSIDLAEVGA